MKGGVKKIMNKKFEAEVEKLTRAELKHAKQNIRKYLEGAMLNLLGLEKRYGNEYEIDHCNGRNSVLIDAFRSLAINEAKKIAEGYKPKKEELSIYEAAFKKELNSQFGYAIRDVAKVKAIELAKEAGEKIQIDVDRILEEEFKKD